MNDDIMNDTLMNLASLVEVEGITFVQKSNICPFIELCCVNDGSMRKYIDNFINDTCLDILDMKTSYYPIYVCPKISKLNLEVIEILKKQEKYILIFFDENFRDENRLLTMLPEHIKYIKLEGSNMLFNEELELEMTNLPRELICLDIGYKMKYELTLDYLPIGLKVLRMGAKLDVPIDNLPQGLEFLEIGKQFNHSIDNLPDSIKILIFKKMSSSWNRPDYLYIKKINKLPLELEILILDNVHDDIICEIDFNYLDKLTYLALPTNFDKHEFFNSSNIKWPPKLSKLHIGKTYNQDINILPYGLEYLVVHQNFDLEKNLIFVPSSLKKVMVDVRREIMLNNNCHYGTFKKIKNKFPNINVGFLSS